jgi:hypothetical protein
VTFADLEAGDVFLMTWWLTSGPQPRAYMVVDKHPSELSLTIVRLEAAADSTPTRVRLSLLEEAQTRGEIRLIEILPLR